MKNRQKNLLKHANKAGHNAIVALDPENLFYMTGFWGEAIGVLDSSGAKIIVPALEASRAKADSSDCKVLSSDRGSSMITDLVSLLRGKKPCTDCTNYTTMTTLQKKIRNLKNISLSIAYVINMDCSWDSFCPVFMDFAHNANMPSIMEDALRRVLISYASLMIRDFENGDASCFRLRIFFCRVVIVV